MNSVLRSDHDVQPSWMGTRNNPMLRIGIVNSLIGQLDNTLQGQLDNTERIIPFLCHMIVQRLLEKSTNVALYSTVH